MIAPAPLFISHIALDRLHRLREDAMLRPVDMIWLMAAIETEDGKASHRCHMHEQSVLIPGMWNFTVTYSIEINHPVGPCRHMSMAIEREGRVPNPEAVWMVAIELGFKGALSDCAVWIEDIEGGKAVNVVQPLRAYEAAVISYQGEDVPN